MHLCVSRLWHEQLAGVVLVFYILPDIVSSNVNIELKKQCVT